MTTKKIDSKPEREIPRAALIAGGALLVLLFTLFGVWSWHRNIEIDQARYREVMRAARGSVEIRTAINNIMKEDGQINNHRFSSELEPLLATAKPLVLPGLRQQQQFSSSKQNN